MTGMPAADDERLLVCDGCGRSRRGPTWDLTWIKATQDGWTGIARAIGPHYCPTCSAAHAR